jgi:hypothetical protein
MFIISPLRLSIVEKRALTGELESVLEAARYNRDRDPSERIQPLNHHESDIRPAPLSLKLTVHIDIVRQQRLRTKLPSMQWTIPLKRPGLPAYFAGSFSGWSRRAGVRGRI